jgi:syntenin-1
MPNAPPISQADIYAAYPALADMGLQLTPEEVALLSSGPVAVRPPMEMASPPSGPEKQVMAPVSGQSLGYYRAQVTHGIREVVLCKGNNEKVGLKIAAVNKGVFVVLVSKGSPAAMVGLRFGDQILQIDGENVAGYSADKVHSMIKKGPVNGIKLAVRDRTLARTITLHKDSANHIGFHFKNGKIDAIVKDSSAARNGLLTEQQLLEVDGQNVIGLQDKDTRKIIDAAGTVVTLTIIPSFFYDSLIKNTASSILKKMMDHSIPEL